MSKDTVIDSTELTELREKASILDRLEAVLSACAVDEPPRLSWFEGYDAPDIDDVEFACFRFSDDDYRDLGSGDTIADALANFDARQAMRDEDKRDVRP